MINNSNIPHYTSTMPLQTQYVTNADKCGEHIFTQLKREGNICLYKRESLDHKPFGYEVFITKVIKAGTPLPNNNQVENDYEIPASKSNFGKSAWFTNSIERANQIFNRLVSENIVEENQEKIVAGIPVKEFTTKELAESLKIDNTQARKIIMDWIDQGNVKELRREQINKMGKPTTFFIKC